MGTRSLTIINGKWEWKGKVTQKIETEEEEIAVMYRQMDGYPSGMGRDLAEYLSGATVVNGLSSDQHGLIFNGAHCAAASIVAHFKEGAGSIYLHSAGSRDIGEEYRYYLWFQDGKPIRMMVCECEYHWKNDTSNNYTISELTIFDGTPEEFMEWLEKENEDGS